MTHRDGKYFPKATEGVGTRIAESVLELRCLKIWNLWGGILEIFKFSTQILAVKPFLPHNHNALLVKNQKERLKHRFMLSLSPVLFPLSSWALHHADSPAWPSPGGGAGRMLRWFRSLVKHTWLPIPASHGTLVKSSLDLCFHIIARR